MEALLERHAPPLEVTRGHVGGIFGKPREPLPTDKSRAISFANILFKLPKMQPHAFINRHLGAFLS